MLNREKFLARLKECQAVAHGEGRSNVWVAMNREEIDLAVELLANALAAETSANEVLDQALIDNG